MAVLLRLASCLPGDSATVGVVRRLLGQAMGTLGVESGCADDICLMLNEACANVVDHADEADRYEISAELDDRRCTIEVVNAGDVVEPARFDVALEQRCRPSAAVA